MAMMHDEVMCAGVLVIQSFFQMHHKREFANITKLSAELERWSYGLGSESDSSHCVPMRLSDETKRVYEFVRARKEEV